MLQIDHRNSGIQWLLTGLGRPHGKQLNGTTSNLVRKPPLATKLSRSSRGRESVETGHQKSALRGTQKHLSQKLALFIISAIILLEQNLVHFHHINPLPEPTSPPPPGELLRKPSLFYQSKGFLLFAEADSSAQKSAEELEDQIRIARETERVNNLFRESSSAFDLRHGGQELDFTNGHDSPEEPADSNIKQTGSFKPHHKPPPPPPPPLRFYGDQSIYASYSHHKHRSHDGDSVGSNEQDQHSHLRDRTKRHNGLEAAPFEGSADRPLVTTRSGSIRGTTQRIFTGKVVDAFLGIPFAKPPIGKYRFRHPQPINAWPGELDASRMSNSCYQVNDTFFGATFGGTSIWNANTPLDENCLHLNIWTPFGAANAAISPAHDYRRTMNNPDNIKRPVLVWIFGGGFYSGTSTLKLYDGGVLASEEDIIVVSVNYRVAALGFLYFNRPDAPGNAGLFDQLLALQWINENINQFGGDPSRVTIFGESAGAVSAAYHLLSPLSRDLFSQAILQSGAATNPWGSIEAHDIIANGLQLAAALNCPSDQKDLDSVIECLLKADPMALVSQEVGQTRSIINFPFVPVVDGSFLLEPPMESLMKSNFKQARILLGSNNHEGSSYLIYLSEFSHCPSPNGNNDETGTSARAPHSPETSTAKIATQIKSSQQGTPDYSNTSGDDLESLDLIRPERQTSASYPSPESTTTLHQPSENQTLQRSAAASQKQQQQQQFVYLQSDTKPCRPNDELSLSRDGFLQILSEEINPYAEHPIGKKAIVFEYSNWNNPNDPVSNYDGLDKIVGDYYFTCHVNELAYRYAQAGNAVFMYYFKQRSSMSPWPQWMGVLHGDEISFVFGEPLNPIFNHTQKEIELSRRMMKYWANFAKFGEPTKNGENTTMAEKWPEYADRRQYFELHGDYIRIGRGPRSKQCAFWSQYLPQLLQSFDKYNQCRITGSHQPLQKHHLSSYRGPQDHASLTTIPSFLLFSFIVILLLAGLAASFAIVSRRSSWKFNFWPNVRAGNSASSSPDDEDDGSASRTGRHNNSSNA